MSVYIIIGIFLVIGIIAIHNEIKFTKSNNKTEMPFEYTPIEYEADRRELLIWKYINDERAVFSLNLLKADYFISSLAKRRCLEVDNQNEPSHKTVGDELLELKKKGADSSAEILTYGFNSPRGVVNGWMRSEKHRKAILNSEHDYIGISSRLDEKGKWIDIAVLVNEQTVK